MSYEDDKCLMHQINTNKISKYQSIIMYTRDYLQQNLSHKIFMKINNTY